jgi:hypothetical protein
LQVTTSIGAQRIDNRINTLGRGAMPCLAHDWLAA